MSALVTGNFIGTDATGTRAVGNRGDGVSVQFGFLTTIIGGTAPGAGNLISGNFGNGIVIFGSSTPPNLVQGNQIGVDVTGTNPLGNAGDGVSVTGAANMVGGTVSGAGNIIAFNGADGVRVGGSTGNGIRGNSIYGHANGLEVELVNNGNNNQPAPVLNDAKSHGSRTKVTGTLTGRANTSFTLEFFSNTDCNPSGYGEGEVFLGSLAVMTDATGNASFLTHLDAAVAPGQYVTATATDPSGNTSEFSQCVVVRGHGHPGGIDRSEVPLSDRAVALLGRLGDHVNVGAGGALMDAHCAQVDRGTAAVIVAGYADLAQVVMAASDWLPARFGSDLFFSGFSRDGANNPSPGGVSVGPLDEDWVIADGWMGGLPLNE